MRKISICIVLGRLLAMLRIWINVCRFRFCAVLIIVHIRTDFTTSASRMLLRPIMNRRCFMPLIPMHASNQDRLAAKPKCYYYSTRAAAVRITSRGLGGGLAAPKAPPLNPPLNAESIINATDCVQQLTTCMQFDNCECKH